MNLKLRWIITIVVIGWSLYAMYPLSQKIKLGLDLQGGMHVVLGVDTEKAVEARVDGLVGQIRKELSSKDFNITYVQKDSADRIRVGLSDSGERAAVVKAVKEGYPYLGDVGTGSDAGTIVLGLDNSEVQRIKSYAVDQSIEVVRNRIDQFGVSEPLIQKQGSNQILVQLPGITDPERAINLIGQTAQLKFYLVDEKVNPEAAVNGSLPYDDVLMYQKITEKGTGKVLSTVPYVLKRDAVLTGDYLTDAEVRISPQYNEPYVWIRFDPAGARLFEEITGANVGTRLAIVLDDNVYSAPNLREKIAGGEAQITGQFTLEAARDLAIVLRAGSLPAPVSIQENRTVGPSLGLDSIKSGVRASLIGIIAIMLFMGIYYRLSGWVANIALALNLVLLLGVLAQFEATLTLPGIAGVVLTLGMAVDANVLIFERIREELRQGRTVLNAIDIGYSKALTTIIDSNVTSLIAAVVLFQFGSGPVKGFAVTLTIGLIASMFTAIFVTRTIFMSFLSGRSVKRLSI